MQNHLILTKDALSTEPNIMIYTHVYSVEGSQLDVGEKEFKSACLPLTMREKKNNLQIFSEDIHDLCYGALY